MAVEIKGGNSSDLATVDAVSKAVRVTNYDSAGNVVDLNVPITVACNDVTVVNNDVIDSLDVSAYAFVSLQLTGTWEGTVQFEGSNDNGTFDPVVSQDMGEALVPYVSSTTNTGIFKIPTAFKYLRVRVTAYTSGTVTGTSLAYKIDSNTGQISAIGTVDLAAGSATIGTVRVGPLSDDTPAGFKFSNLAGTNAQSIKGSAGNIHFLWITSTAVRYVKLYDKATAPVVGTDIPKYTFPLGAGANPIPVPAGGFSFVNGIGFACLLSAGDSGTVPHTVTNEVGVMMEYT